MKRLIGFLVMFAAAIGAYFSLTSILWQHHAVRDFVPAPAEILHSAVGVHRGKSTTYSPDATYTYVFKNQTYHSQKVLPISMSTSDRAWAQGVLDRIDGAADPQKRGPEGGWHSTAYVNPDDPSQAILVRDYSILPYAFGMGTLQAAMVGLGLLLGVIGAGRTKMTALALDDSGWQLLLPTQQLRRQFRNALCWLVGSALALAAMPVHWIFVAGQHGLAALITGAIALGAIAALAGVAFRRWSVSRHLSDVRLHVKPVPLQRGAPFALELEADAHTPLRVQSVQARIVCVEHYREKHGNKTSYGTRVRGEKNLHLAHHLQIPAGEVVAGKGEATIGPAEFPPTTDITIKQYPYYTWEIRVAIALEGLVDYAAVFPLDVT